MFIESQILFNEILWKFNTKVYKISGKHCQHLGRLR